MITEYCWKHNVNFSKNGKTYSEKCSSHDGFNVADLTDVLYRCDGFVPMYMVTNGSDRPFGSFGWSSFASTTSTSNRISGGFFCDAADSSSSWRAFVIYPTVQFHSTKEKRIQKNKNLQKIRTLERNLNEDRLNYFECILNVGVKGSMACFIFRFASNIV